MCVRLSWSAWLYFLGDIRAVLALQVSLRPVRWKKTQLWDPLCPTCLGAVGLCSFSKVPFSTCPCCLASTSPSFPEMSILACFLTRSFPSPWSWWVLPTVKNKKKMLTWNERVEIKSFWNSPAVTSARWPSRMQEQSNSSLSHVAFWLAKGASES